MSLQIQGLSYIHPDRNILFHNISFSLPAGGKCAIVGNNGVGKSTLLKVIFRMLPHASGIVSFDDVPYMIPQHFGQFDDMTVAQALGVEEKLEALSHILDGRGTEKEFESLDNDWDIKERLSDALTRWGIGHIGPDMPVRDLSGGEKTKVFLSGLELFCPSLVLMDEPTNHLDTKGREQLYDYISRASCSIIVVSHDRTLLNLLPAIYEMSSAGMQYYPMGYDEYKATVDAEFSAKNIRWKASVKSWQKLKSQRGKLWNVSRNSPREGRGRLRKSAWPGLPRGICATNPSQPPPVLARCSRRSWIQ